MARRNIFIKRFGRLKGESSRISLSQWEMGCVSKAITLGFCNIIEVHIVQEGFLHRIISAESCKKWLTQEGTFRISLPWEIPNLDLEAIQYDSGRTHLTGKTTNGMEACGHYRVIFSTLAGPISVNAWVPMFK